MAHPLRARVRIAPLENVLFAIPAGVDGADQGVAALPVVVHVGIGVDVERWKRGVHEVRLPLNHFPVCTSGDHLPAVETGGGDAETRPCEREEFP